MNYYAAKFAREEKENPREWIIQTDPVTGACRLVRIVPRDYIGQRDTAYQY